MASLVEDGGDIPFKKEYVNQRKPRPKRKLRFEDHLRNAKTPPGKNAMGREIDLPSLNDRRRMRKRNRVAVIGSRG